MVCLDSSILIGQVRAPGSAWAEEAAIVLRQGKACICGQIWVEVVGGYRSQSRRKTFTAYLQAFPWLETSREAFELAAEWVAKYRNFGPGDAIIAATVLLNDATLLTADNGFRVLEPEGLRFHPVA